VEFNRFIPDRPNLISFKLEVVGIDRNEFIQSWDCEWAQYITEIDIWCYNEDYPKMIEVDMRWVNPKVSYKLSITTH